MNETEFNLLDEPWIRVMDDNCQIKEVSLTDALLNAHKYKALKGEMPTQDIVILRLMLAIVHTVFSRVDAVGFLHLIRKMMISWKSLNSGRILQRG
ncbi:type I-E CRISPR-associated protein Cse1/CasA [Ruminococcus sp.]|uniref:type I-E CRISPR-associated protein Cse1/CasA n=1 Tax=Ruminococcus sp. TaxID=41978 RepID=UPI00257D2CB7|nr:type I-E CRISPR-associated protein Cse1/CasA [Ruminococcus sp.]